MKRSVTLAAALVVLMSGGIAVPVAHAQEVSCTEAEMAAATCIMGAVLLDESVDVESAVLESVVVQGKDDTAQKYTANVEAVDASRGEKLTEVLAQPDSELQPVMLPAGEVTQGSASLPKKPGVAQPNGGSDGTILSDTTWRLRAPIGIHKCNSNTGCSLIDIIDVEFKMYLWTRETHLGTIFKSRYGSKFNVTGLICRAYQNIAWAPDPIVGNYPSGACANGWGSTRYENYGGTVKGMKSDTKNYTYFEFYVSDNYGLYSTWFTAESQDWYTAKSGYQYFIR